MGKRYDVERSTNSGRTWKYATDATSLREAKVLRNLYARTCPDNRYRIVRVTTTETREVIR